MSVNTKINEQLRHSNLQAQEIELYKNSFVLVPYQVSGVQDYTNRGATTRQVRPEDYETFKRVWTGNDAAQIQWKDSIYFTKTTLENGEEEAKIQFRLGEVMLGLMEVNSTDIRIQQDTSLSDYISQDLKQSYTFRVDRKKFEITDYHQICLWKIPEVSGSTLFRISSIEKDYIGKELVGYVLTFESINQDLANTGSARQQNIMPSAIGQGYLECKIEDSTWPDRLGEEFNNLIEGVDYLSFYGKFITADYAKVQNRPAKKIVVKQLGLGILSSVACIGRPVQLGESFEKYKQPRLLFPVNYTNPTTPTLFHTQQEINNYYFGNFAPSLKYWKEWKENIKDTYQAGVSKWEYEGLLEYDIEQLRATNQKIDGTYEYDLYGKLVKNGSKVERVPWSFTEKVKSIDTSMVIGCENTYDIGGNKAIHDHMFDNYWTQKYMKVLPLTITSTAAMGLLGDIIGAAIGGVFAEIVQNFAIWLVGTFKKWIGRANPLKYQTFRGIICADFIELSTNFINTSSGNKALPLDVFKANGNNDTPASLMFNGNSVLTSFEADLTDRFNSKRYVGTLNTLNIGQAKFENGDWIFDNHASFLLNGDTTLTETTSDGFIIDEIQINGIFNGEYSIEFLDGNGDVIWSSIFQSAGMWSNSIRDTWTTRNTSVYNRENVYFTEPFKYPEKLDEPLLAIPDLTQESSNIRLARTYWKNESGDKKHFGRGSNDAPLSLIVPDCDGFINPNNIFDKPEIGIKLFEYDEYIKDFGLLATYYKKLKIAFSMEYIVYSWLDQNNRGHDTPKTKEVMWFAEIPLPNLNTNEKIILPDADNAPYFETNWYGEKRKYWLKSFDFFFYEQDNKLMCSVSNVKFEDLRIKEIVVGFVPVPGNAAEIIEKVPYTWFPQPFPSTFNNLRDKDWSGFNPTGFVEATWDLDFTLIPKI